MRDGLRVGLTAGYVVIGAAALVLSVGGLSPTATPLVVVFSTLVPTTLVLALVGSGLWLSVRSDFTVPEFHRLSVWSLAGMSTFGSFALAFVIVTSDEFGLANPELLVAETVVGGALAGLGIGLYDVLADRQRTQLEAERERLDVLNRMLRHHMLNGMNIILANAEELQSRDDDPDRELRTISRRGGEVVSLVERVSDLTDRIHDQPDPTPRRLDGVLSGPVAQAQAAHGTRQVRLSEPIPEVSVLGDETLQEAVETVLFERAQVSDGLVVETEVTTDDVVVRVDDHGGAPLTAADGGGSSGWTPFSASDESPTDADEGGGSERYAASLNQGVDIYMAELLLSRSGGRLEVSGEDRSVVELHLPRA